MVEPAVGIGMAVEARRTQRVHSLQCQFRMPWRRVAQLVERRGKPPKSWIVSGRGLLVTPMLPRVIQCGETISTASGRGSCRPSADSRSPAMPGSSAKVGAPWETNRTGGMGALLRLEGLDDRWSPMGMVWATGPRPAPGDGAVWGVARVWLRPR